jgi:GT2 family glycosyltransferase
VPSADTVLAALSLGIWLYLFVARGNFWRLRVDDDQAEYRSLQNWPRVAAIVPARNEAETIGQTVAALLEQVYPGEFSITVVDDHSEDETSQIARRTAKENAAGSRVSIHSASALPSGWTGKLWALHEGVLRSASATNESSRAERGISFRSNQSTTKTEATSDDAPTYFWFTDADVLHAPDTLSRLVSRAEQDKLDLTSLMVLLRAKTLPERALIPAFLFFFLKLYPPRWIARPRSRTAGAAGGCVLLRRKALERIGGLAAIRSEVIDDCALARAVKHSGGKIWMGLTRKSLSQRAYGTFAEIRDMIARTAFTQLRYSTLLLLGTLGGLFLTYIAPVLLLFTHHRDARVLALITWLLMSAVYLPTIRFYRLAPHRAPLLPLAALFYAYATWLSAVRYWRNRGAQWKGRAQAHRKVNRTAREP